MWNKNRLNWKKEKIVEMDPLVLRKKMFTREIGKLDMELVEMSIWHGRHRAMLPTDAAFKCNIFDDVYHYLQPQDENYKKTSFTLEKPDYLSSTSVTPDTVASLIYDSSLGENKWI